MGVSARPIDQRFYPGFAQLTKRCVGRESSSPARILRSPIQLIARIGIMGEVSRSMRERRPVCLPIGDEGITTVIGDVQPLMSVRRPGVCLPRSCEEMSVASTRRRPESERSVDVNPRAVLFGNWDQRLKIIECTDAEVACLEHDNSRYRGVLLQSIREGFRRQASIRIGLQADQVLFAQTQQTDSSNDGSMFSVLVRIRMAGEPDSPSVSTSIPCFASSA
jgi:hypothetical protein